MMLKLFYKSKLHEFNLVQGDCIDVLSQLDFQFDMIFADPPYFLSNGGISVQSGKQVSVTIKVIGINLKGSKKITNLIENGLQRVANT